MFAIPQVRRPPGIAEFEAGAVVALSSSVKRFARGPDAWPCRAAPAHSDFKCVRRRNPQALPAERQISQISRDHSSFRSSSLRLYVHGEPHYRHRQVFDTGKLLHR